MRRIDTLFRRLGGAPTIAMLLACAAMPPIAALAQGSFTLTCDPAQLEIEQGDRDTTRCTVSSQGGFSEPVSLSCLDLPAGFTCGYEPNPVTPPRDGSASSTLTIGVSRDTPPGTYWIKPHGRSTSSSSTTSVSVGVVVATGFSVACSPSSLSVAQGGSNASTCTVTSSFGFNGAVLLSCANLPNAVSCSFNPASVTPPPGGSVSSTLTVAAGGSAALGSSTFQVRGTSGSLIRSTNLNLTVTGALTTVFFDDFETDQGWVTNPDGTDTATTGLWERADPEQTVYSSAIMQLGTTPSGTRDLVTGHLAGAGAGAYDVDGGTTSIRSPAISLPASGTITLSLKYYFSHASNSTNADFFRVSIVSGGSTTQVFQELGSAANDAAFFAPITLNLGAFAGQTIRILFTATDGGTASLVEAAVDDVRVTKQ